MSRQKEDNNFPNSSSSPFSFQGPPQSGNVSYDLAEGETPALLDPASYTAHRLVCDLELCLLSASRYSMDEIFTKHFFGDPLIAPCNSRALTFDDATRV